MDRLPPGRRCVETDEDEVSLTAYMDAIQRVHSFDRVEVRRHAAAIFATSRIIDSLLLQINELRAIPAVQPTEQTCRPANST
jgi:hypothetical protein